MNKDKPERQSRESDQAQRLERREIDTNRDAKPTPELFFLILLCCPTLRSDLYPGPLFIEYSLAASHR